MTASSVAPDSVDQAVAASFTAAALRKAQCRSVQMLQLSWLGWSKPLIACIHGGGCSCHIPTGAQNGSRCCCCFCRECANIFKGKAIEKGVAFPSCVSPNRCEQQQQQQQGPGAPETAHHQQHQGSNRLALLTVT